MGLKNNSPYLRPILAINTQSDMFVESVRGLCRDAINAEIDALKYECSEKGWFSAQVEAGKDDHPVFFVDKDGNRIHSWDGFAQSFWATHTTGVGEVAAS